MKKLELAEAPVLEVTKSGTRFQVREIPAYSLGRLGECLGNPTTENISAVLEILFREDAEKARDLFTMTDIASIARALHEAGADPLESSSENDTDTQ